MPNSKSAKKRLLTSEKGRLCNQTRKSRVRTARTKFMELLEAKDVDGASAALRTCFATLDRAAKANSISRNKANRTKSRLARSLGAIKQAG